MIKGTFRPSSGQMTGSYRERTYNYQVVGWIKSDEYTPHDQKIRKQIQPSQLGEAEALYVKVTGPNIDGEEYRYLWGPFPGGEGEIDTHLVDMFTYGSQ